MKKIVILCLSCFFASYSYSQIKPKFTGDQNLYAVVIGNENYQSYGHGYVENALHAIYNAEQFKQHLVRDLQYNEKNVFFMADATNGIIKLLLTKSRISARVNASLIVASLSCANITR